MDFDELCEKDGEKELQDADREGGWAEMAKCIEWRDKEIRELRTRVADLEQCLSGRARFQENEALKNRLSTLLKASEGMEKALDSLVEHTIVCEEQLDKFHGLGNDSGSGSSVYVLNAQSAIADFRAVNGEK